MCECMCVCVCVCLCVSVCLCVCVGVYVCVCVCSEKTCCMLTAIVSVKGADKAPLVAGERTQLRGKIHFGRLDSYRMQEVYNIGIIKIDCMRF